MKDEKDQTPPQNISYNVKSAEELERLQEAMKKVTGMCNIFGKGEERANLKVCWWEAGNEIMIDAETNLKIVAVDIFKPEFCKRIQIGIENRVNIEMSDGMKIQISLDKS